MENEVKKQRWFKSPWVLSWLLLVIIVLAVNIYMIMQSLNDFPGLVVDDFYERGQDYEENIHTKLANNDKWKTNFLLTPIKLNEPTTVKFTITDQQGKSATIEKMTMYVYRPSDAKQDFSVPMEKTDEENTYKSDITFKLKGRWDLLANLVIDGIEVNYAQRVFVNE